MWKKKKGSSKILFQEATWRGDKWFPPNATGLNQAAADTDVNDRDIFPMLQTLTSQTKHPPELHAPLLVVWSMRTQ